MMFDAHPKSDLKGSLEGKVVPGFPTESVMNFEDASDSPAAVSPVLVRRISGEDVAKLKAFSIENDNSSWLSRKIFKKEVKWPRQLYLNVVGCKALVPQPPNSEGQTATASVTTDGDAGDPASAANGHAYGTAGSGEGGGDLDQSAGLSGSGEGANSSRSRSRRDVESSAGGEAEPEPEPEPEPEAEPDGVGGEDEHEPTVGCSSHSEWVEQEKQDEAVTGTCFVRIHNATTGRDLQTNAIQGDVNPVFHETFIVPCQGPRDAVVLEVFFGEGEHKAQPIGEAALPLDSRVLGASHPVLLSVKDKHGRSRGFLRVETFWLDEAKPKKETGEFYYKVVHPSGVSLREQPSIDAERTVHVLGHGEVFVASERQWVTCGGGPGNGPDGPGDGPVFVKVMTSKDRWNRSGWCFESLSTKRGVTVPVLERTTSPLRESGRYFYRVCHPGGARLHRKADPKSKLHKEVLPQGQVLEACHKWTPAGSPVTYVTLIKQRGGFIIQKSGDKVVTNDAGEPVFEEMECPTGTVVSSVGVPESPPVLASPVGPESEAAPGAGRVAAAVAAIGSGAGSEAAAAGGGGGAGKSRSPSSSPSRQRKGMKVDKKKELEAAAAAASVRRLYRVREEAGVEATNTPDIVAPGVDRIDVGTAFYGKAEVVKQYEGIGEVAFVMRETDGLWVRANIPGVALLLDVFTNAVEHGAFTYRVSHENGVLVRTAPGMNAPPVKPRRILPVTKLVSVCERLTRAEDIMNLSRPPTFLRLAGNDGWVFDRRAHILVCEDVTVKSRIATAIAISSEAARLAKGGIPR